MIVNLGPTEFSIVPMNSVPMNPRPDGLGPNPRCLRRDVNRNAAMGATADKMLSLLNKKEMNDLYLELLAIPQPMNDPYPWGVRPPLDHPPYPPSL